MACCASPPTTTVLRGDQLRVLASLGIAALVKAGAFATYEEALEEGIRPGRPCCKLNKMMRASLAEWQRLYVETKKGN